MMSVNDELLAREHIRDVIYRYCRALDSRDWEGVRACFAPDATINHDSYSGPVDRFLDFAIDILEKWMRRFIPSAGLALSLKMVSPKLMQPSRHFIIFPGNMTRLGLSQPKA